MAEKEVKTPLVPVAEADAKPAPKVYAISIETFARENAIRVNSRGEEVPAFEMMGAFASQMLLEGRGADTAENYGRDWEAFKRS